jgi:L-lysine exporter family protein LysE/ArgO
VNASFFTQDFQEFIMTIATSVAPLLHGFLLSVSIIMAIGPQNLFILRQGLKRQHLFVTALFSTLADMMLIALAVGGLSATIASNNLLLVLIALTGMLFLSWYGGGALLRAYRGGTAANPGAAQAATSTVRATIVAALCFSLLNPAMYLDTVVIIGSASLSFSLYERIFFAIGAIMASTVWFFSLCYGAGRLSPVFRSPLAWRVLDVISGCIMLVMASTLLHNLITTA